VRKSAATRRRTKREPGEEDRGAQKKSPDASSDTHDRTRLENAADRLPEPIRELLLKLGRFMTQLKVLEVLADKVSDIVHGVERFTADDEDDDQKKR